MEIEWTAVAASISNMLAPLAGIIGVVVGHMLNRGHNRREKIKDLRRVAYSSILSELASAQPAYDRAADEISEDPHAYHASERWDRHYEQISEHVVAARQYYTEQYLILSDAFISRWEAMMDARAVAANSDPDDPFVNVEAHGDIVRSARVDLMEIARWEVAA